jgi:hypothetical protein
MMEAHPHSSTTSKLARWSLVLLALCPFAASLGFHFIGPRTAASAAVQERPALAFDQYAVNLGPIEPMSLAEGKFRFTNTSDRTVKITELRPSCGCMNPQLEKREYAPGETGQFSVQVATAGEKPGPRHYTVTMEYLDPEPQSVLLTFRLELPPRQLYITPRALLVYQFGEEPTTKDILVTDNRPHPADVTGVESRADFVTAELAGTETDAEGVQSTRIHVTIGSVPLGVHNALLKVRTSDPEFPVLNVPVRVHRQASIPKLSTAARDGEPSASPGRQ